MTCPIAKAISLQGAPFDALPTEVADSTRSISLRALQQYRKPDNGGMRISIQALQRYSEHTDSVPYDSELDRTMYDENILLNKDSLRLDSTCTDLDKDSVLRDNDKILRDYISTLLDNDTLLFVAFYALIPQETEGAKAPLLRLKTNAVGWALLNSNIAVEYCFANHWSVSLPAYYGALDYFTSRVKFRTLTILPELRYYTRLDAGLFVGLHSGICYYNFAIGGTTRFQDHNGNEPAVGGGFTAGYILPLGKSHHWNVEFSLGVGMYRHHYDKFYNYKNGPLYARKTKTALYVDNLAASFSYTFDLNHRHAQR